MRRALSRCLPRVLPNAPFLTAIVEFMALSQAAANTAAPAKAVAAAATSSAAIAAASSAAVAAATLRQPNHTASLVAGAPAPTAKKPAVAAAAVPVAASPPVNPAAHGPNGSAFKQVVASSGAAATAKDAGTAAQLPANSAWAKGKPAVLAGAVAVTSGVAKVAAKQPQQLPLDGQSAIEQRVATTATAPTKVLSSRAEESVIAAASADLPPKARPAETIASELVQAPATGPASIMPLGQPDGHGSGDHEGAGASPASHHQVTKGSSAGAVETPGGEPQTKIAMWEGTNIPPATSGGDSPTAAPDSSKGIPAVRSSAPDLGASAVAAGEADPSVHSDQPDGAAEATVAPAPQLPPLRPTSVFAAASYPNDPATDDEAAPRSDAGGAAAAAHDGSPGGDAAGQTGNHRGPVNLSSSSGIWRARSNLLGPPQVGS